MAVQEESTTPVMTLLAESAAEPASSPTWNTRPRRRDDAVAIDAVSTLALSRSFRPMGERPSTLQPWVSVERESAVQTSPDNLLRVTAKTQVRQLDMLNEVYHSGQIDDGIAGLAR